MLYACESGSRAWGFASPDSDYDVRFIYAAPLDYFLTLEPGSDVIEEFLPNDLDVSGWELRKALRLLRKSNPPLLEWIQSPIVYAEEPVFITAFRDVAAATFSPLKAFHHYFSMARTNYRTYLQGDRVRLKKYFYVLRPLLAARHVEATLSMAPIGFDDVLMHAPSEALREAILELKAQKMAVGELSEGPRIAVISDFIEAELRRYERADPLPDPRSDVAPFDDLLRETVLRCGPIA